MKISRKWAANKIMLAILVSFFIYGNLGATEVFYRGRRLPLYPNEKLMNRLERKYMSKRDNVFIFRPHFRDYTILWYYTDNEIVVIKYKIGCFPSKKRYRNEGLSGFSVDDVVLSYNNYERMDVISEVSDETITIFIRRLSLYRKFSLGDYLVKPSESKLEEKIKQDIIKYIIPKYSEVKERETWR